MKSRTGFIFEMLRSSFWLVPVAIAATLMALVPVLSVLELPSPSANSFLFPKASGTGAGLILSSIATASMTVVSVLFSITMLVLQQVSQQYTPRVVENFIRSYPTQTVLGFYVGTFGYCILYLRQVPDAQQDAVPELSVAVAVGILLALICLALLIYYVQHVAKSIKSNQILARIAKSAVQSLDNICDDLHHLCPARDNVRETTDNFAERCEVSSCRSGYLQEIDLRKLVKVLGRGSPWRADIAVRAGNFIHQDTPLLSIQSASRIQDDIQSKLRDAFTIDLVRTHSQDPLFGIRQMSDIALRALSPGINDPSTAVEAVNEIGTVLLHYIKYFPETAVLTFGSGCSLDTKNVSFDEFLGSCFDQIVLSGKNFASVLGRICSVLSHCETQAKKEKQGTSLRAKELEVRQVLRKLHEESPVTLNLPT